MLIPAHVISFALITRATLNAAAISPIFRIFIKYRRISTRTDVTLPTPDVSVSTKLAAVYPARANSGVAALKDAGVDFESTARSSGRDNDR